MSKHIEILEKFKESGYFNIDKFKAYTLNKSLAAAHRESKTTHKFEYLADGYKGIFFLSNYLGGVYHLTADEVYEEGDTFIIQESKNVNNKKMPSVDDIKDGLFKLMLFSNLESLFLDNAEVKFTTRLKITGSVKGSLNLQSDFSTREAFCQNNTFSPTQRQLVELLYQETIQKPKLSIIITSNE